MSVVRVTVRAKPGASRVHVGGSHGTAGELIVAVTARAVDGAANDAVVRAVAESLDLRPRDVAIVGGHRSRTKVLAVAVADGDVARVEAAIMDLRNARSR